MGQSSVLRDPGCVSPSPALAFSPWHVLALVPLVGGEALQSSSFGWHWQPEALISFALHKPQCSKYEGKGRETNLAVPSAGFQYGLSSVGFFPLLKLLIGRLRNSCGFAFFFQCLLVLEQFNNAA